MLDNLTFGEAVAVPPKKMDRRGSTLPQGVATAYEITPMGEARTLQVNIPIADDREKIGTRLVALLKREAADRSEVAFKANFTTNDDGVLLYWQRKPARHKKVNATAEQAAEFGEQFEAAAEEPKKKGGKK